MYEAQPGGSGGTESADGNGLHEAGNLGGGI